MVTHELNENKIIEKNKIGERTTTRLSTSTSTFFVLNNGAFKYRVTEGVSE